MLSGNCCIVAGYGLCIGGAFIASTVCPVLTPLSALALGVVLGTAKIGYIPCQKIADPEVREVVSRIITGLILSIGFVAMHALGLPCTLGAVFASVGFTLAIALGAVLIGGAVLLICANVKGVSFKSLLPQMQEALLHKSSLR